MRSGLLRRLRPRGPRPPALLGHEGERLALAHLKSLGYRIVATNVRIPLGHSPSGRARIGEIDIIAYEGQMLVFVEVKTRAHDGRYPAEAAVDARKRRLLAWSARGYRRIMAIGSEPHRFDVVSILMPPGESARVRLTRGYFSEPPRSRWTFTREPHGSG